MCELPHPFQARGETRASIDAEAYLVVIPAKAGTQAGFPLSRE